MAVDHRQLTAPNNLAAHRAEETIRNEIAARAEAELARRIERLRQYVAAVSEEELNRICRAAGDELVSTALVSISKHTYNVANPTKSLQTCLLRLILAGKAPASGPEDLADVIETLK